MTKGIEEEEEEEVQELDGEMDESFAPDDSMTFDDYDDDFSDIESGGGGGGNSGDAVLTESNYEDAVRANPKRLSAAQRKKASSIIEGIIDDAELTDPESQSRAWGKLNDKIGVAHARKYDIKAEFTENDVIDHPKFGIGFVVELLNPKKVEVLFEDGLRKLACNIG